MAILFNNLSHSIPVLKYTSIYWIVKNDSIFSSKYVDYGDHLLFHCISYRCVLIKGRGSCIIFKSFQHV